MAIYFSGKLLAVGVEGRNLTLMQKTSNRNALFLNPPTLNPNLINPDPSFTPALMLALLRPGFAAGAPQTTAEAAARTKAPAGSAA